MRIFFALWPAHAFAGRLHEFASGLHRQARGRVTALDSIHLTLAFVGEVDEQRVPQAVAAAREVAVPAFSFTMDVFGYWRHNQIVWAGERQASEPLRALAVALADRLRAAGFAIEARPFKSHVTLIRRAGDPGMLPEIDPLVWNAGEFVLVRSLPVQGAVRYPVLERFALGAAGGSAPR